MLNAVLGSDRFPVDVPTVAQEYTIQKYPGDAITRVVGADLPGFDGALFRAPQGKSGWGIFYNSRISSRGRINFTLAHELGHFLLHRIAHPDGIKCGEQDMVRWDSNYAQLEQQANTFAANLLMPLDDFRRRIAASATVDLDQISDCADRYKVSLIAATLRWLSYTDRRAVLVVSRDGYILWSRSSPSALKTGAFFRASSAPIEVPPNSIVGRQGLLVDGKIGVNHPPGVWFREPVREMTIFAEQYDFAISLLLLENQAHFFHLEADPEMDAVDQISPPAGRREW
ncbi:hypothetical protein GGQ61_001191 [Phenylobacterium haematophilum]|uniref:IrrE N-terminal-like domain-containing protein n=1 Tax=Phenylobacterium haematophilum TaxID=98513 RepID=A0A839ZWQ7_9CAUL|nr:hypothetical protein [Phenylobacterium haematophilum]